jgi:hypothetical protein
MTIEIIKLEVRGLDVWGNSEDGYEVNDILGTITEIECKKSDIDTDEKLIKLLKDEDVLNSAKRLFFVDDMSDEKIFCNVLYKDRPIIQVRQI